MLLLSMNLKEGGKYGGDEERWKNVKVNCFARTQSVTAGAWDSGIWENRWTRNVGGIFTKYEEEVQSGRRPPGPIECFAFSTKSRRDCYRYRLRTLRPEAVLGSFRSREGVGSSVAHYYELSAVHWCKVRRICFPPRACL